jgi:hypothetical protein
MGWTHRAVSSCAASSCSLNLVTTAQRSLSGVAAQPRCAKEAVSNRPATSWLCEAAAGRGLAAFRGAFSATAAEVVAERCEPAALACPEARALTARRSISSGDRTVGATRATTSELR